MIPVKKTRPAAKRAMSFPNSVAHLTSNLESLPVGQCPSVQVGCPFSAYLVLRWQDTESLYPSRRSRVTEYPYLVTEKF